VIFDDPVDPPDEALLHRTALLPSRHAFEAARLDSLRDYSPFAPEEDPILQSVALQATHLCRVPVGIVSLMEGDEERFVAHVGTDLQTVKRDESFCAYTLLEPDVLTIEDAQCDPRFRENRYVVGEPYVRFYIGAPIFDAQGLPLGAICAIGFRPQEATSQTRLGLSRLAEVAGAALQARLLFAQSLAGASPEKVPAHQARFEALLLTLVSSCLPSG